jgi:2-phosphosulfolactate phosphatase
MARLERLGLALTPAAAYDALLPHAAVAVIDVLRATTTIVAALDAGALAVVPAQEAGDAIAVRARLGRAGMLLGGERDAERIAGFDLDNSPTSYTSAMVAGKTIAFTTTNGTKALYRAVQGGAYAVFCGALVNRTAVALALERSGVRHAVLLCAGTSGNVALEDFLGAGAIADALLLRNPGIELDDASRAAALLFRASEARLSDAVASGEHAQTLAAKGYATDILIASQLDVSETVPVFRDGEITAV